MKKIVSAILAVLMIVSVMSVLAVIPASAEESNSDDSVADVTGMWNAYGDATAYPKGEDGNPDYTKHPDGTLPGMEYKENGLHVWGNYSSAVGESPKFSIMSSEMLNLKEGISMTVEVDQFSYNSDNWFSFSIWSDQCVAQASNDYGYGYTSLIRTYSKGGVFKEFDTMESYISDKNYWYEGDGYAPGIAGSASNPMTFNRFGTGDGQGEDDIDNYRDELYQNGKYILTMTLNYNKNTGTYELNICGVDVPSDLLSDYLAKRFPNGMAYVGFTLHSDKPDTDVSATLTEYNTATPVGGDYRVPSCTRTNIADVVSKDELDGKDHVLYMDSTSADDYDKVGEFSGSMEVTYTALKNGMFNIVPKQSGHPWVMLSPKDTSSYSIADYPVFAVVLRDYCLCVLGNNEDQDSCLGSEQFMAYICAGDIWKSGADCLFQESANTVYGKDESGDGHYYTLILFDTSSKSSSKLYQGTQRIHKAQFVWDYQPGEGVLSNPGQNNWEFCYGAFFENESSAQSFADEYVKNISACTHPDEYVEVTEAVEATCTSAGQTEGKLCTYCGNVYSKSEVIPAKGHEMTDVEAVVATCTEAGHKAGQKCTREGCDYYTGCDVIEAKGHEPSWKHDDDRHWSVCLRDGCGAALTEKEAHTLDDNQICTTCGYGCEHTNTTHVKENPTCTDDGYEYDECKYCQQKTNYTIIEATGHTEEILPAVDATCTESGLEAGKKCSVCGEILVQQKVIPALGHTLETIEMVPSTCTTHGTATGTICTVCGEKTGCGELPLADHTYDDDNDTDCNICGAKREITTQAPSNNNNNNSNNNSSTSTEEEKKGCGSVAGLGAIAISATVALAGVVCFKKKKD